MTSENFFFYYDVTKVKIFNFFAIFHYDVTKSKIFKLEFQIKQIVREITQPPPATLRQ